MMLLTIVLAPLSFAVLFIVMSWTERALDHQLNRQITPTTLRGHTLRDSRPDVESSAVPGSARLDDDVR